jgi:thioesterase DpgC
VDELCRLAGHAHPKTLPTEEELRAEAALAQRDKKGLEKAQGEFLAQILGDPVAGTHLCHAMLLRREDSREKFSEFDRRGEVELGGVHLSRQGKAAVLTMRNPRYLNAEDESTLDGMEIAVDLALLDPKTQVCVLRGGPVEHPKYAGRRVFGAGI